MGEARDLSEGYGVHPKCAKLLIVIRKMLTQFLVLVIAHAESKSVLISTLIHNLLFESN